MDAAKSTHDNIDTANAETTANDATADPICRSHRINVDDTTLSYTTQCGLMPIRNDKGELMARLFFTSYTLDQPAGDKVRPLTIAFNGGPGSASVWLHMGGLAPK